jgi:hypothetical protein
MADLKNIALTVEATQVVNELRAECRCPDVADIQVIP